jgi:hypothetical protein
MSFKFDRKTDIVGGKQLQNQQQNYYLNYNLKPLTTTSNERDERN